MGKSINLSEPHFSCKYFLTPKYLREGVSGHPILVSSQLYRVQKLNCIEALGLPGHPVGFTGRVSHTCRGIGPKLQRGLSISMTSQGSSEPSLKPQETFTYQRTVIRE